MGVPHPHTPPPELACSEGNWVCSLPQRHLLGTCEDAGWGASFLGQLLMAGMWPRAFLSGLHLVEAFTATLRVPGPVRGIMKQQVTASLLRKQD